MDCKKNDNWLTSVERPSLSKVVVEKIKEAMIRKELKPGDYLPSENELTAQLGVGKSSVREAVKMLEAMGVVEIRKGQGSIIRSTIDTEIMNPLIFQLILQNEDSSALLELRTMFETSATIVAMNHYTEKDLDAILQNVKEMEEKINAGASTIDSDMNFHKLIYQSTHNQFIIYIGTTIMELFRASLEISNNNKPDLVLKDHKAIYKSISEKNEEMLKNAIHQSLNQWNMYSLHK